MTSAIDLAADSPEGSGVTLSDLLTICARCGAANSGSRFCPECGTLMTAGRSPETPSTEADTLGLDEPRAEMTAEDTVKKSAPVLAEAGTVKGEPQGDSNGRSSPRQPRRHAPADKASAQTAPRTETPPSKSRGSERLLRFLVPFIGVVALLALGLALVAIGRPAKSYTAQIKTMHAQLASADSEIATLQANSEASNVVIMLHTLTGLETYVQTAKICIPELEQQLGGESLSNTTQNGYLTNVYITNPTILSSNCTKFLYGG